MPYISHEINAMIAIDPRGAKAKIMAALREAKMHRATAAEKLSCNYGTLLRWIKRLEMEPEIDFLTKKAKREGWFHGKTGGYPKGRPQVERKRAAKKRRVNSIRRK